MIVSLQGAFPPPTCGILLASGLASFLCFWLFFVFLHILFSAYSILSAMYRILWNRSIARMLIHSSQVLTDSSNHILLWGYSHQTHQNQYVKTFLLLILQFCSSVWHVQMLRCVTVALTSAILAPLPPRAFPVRLCGCCDLMEFLVHTSSPLVFLPQGLHWGPSHPFALATSQPYTVPKLF